MNKIEWKFNDNPESLLKYADISKSEIHSYDDFRKLFEDNACYGDCFIIWQILRWNKEVRIYSSR